MNERERFAAIMGYKPVDRLPLYYFGTWPETKQRWLTEGLDSLGDYSPHGSAGPQLAGMDHDWEGSLWDNQRLLNPGPLGDIEPVVVSETATHRICRTSLGGLRQFSKTGSSIPHDLEPDLQPTPEDWRRFRRYLDPDDPRRWLPGWEARAQALQNRTHVSCFFGGSLFGRLRDWLGVENVSLLSYDDPALYEEMVSDLADYYLALAGKLLAKVQFDFAYIFEDCCFNTGPLLSPTQYRQYHHRHYVRLIDGLRRLGVKWILLDSDGKVDDLISGWLEAGVDIVFPIEVGTWKANPAALRQRFGKTLRMMGGVDKHVIPQGPQAIRAHLEPLRDLVAEGGYIPLPDHRIPPDCSLTQFQIYLQVFREVFAPQLVS